MSRTSQLLGAAAVFVLGVTSGYLGSQFFGRPGNATEEGKDQSPAKSLSWYWETDFKTPAVIELSAKEKPILKISVGKRQRLPFDTLTLTIKNLAGRPFNLSYRIYGYDSKNRRVSEGWNSVLIDTWIRPNETVLREVTLLSEGSRTASSFRLSVTADE